MNRKPFTLFIFLLLALLPAGCSPEEAATIEVAVLPILDAFPMYVAADQGYFAEEGVNVEFIPVSSAPERDQIMQAGEADAMINELISNMFYNVEGVEVVAVSYAYRPTPAFAHFYVLAAAESGITAPGELSGEEIGISQATIIEYGTERMLQAEGLSAEAINTVAVPNLGNRLELLNAGELAAATLPDPLAALARANGATVVVADSAYPEYGGSVITFRQEFAEAHPEAVEGFLAAVGRAVAEINADKGQFDELLAERQLIPPPLQGSYVLPDFPEPAVPPASQWNDMVDWALAKGYLESEVSYESSVSDAYLP